MRQRGGATTYDSTPLPSLSTAAKNATIRLDCNAWPVIRQKTPRLGTFNPFKKSQARPSPYAAFCLPTKHQVKSSSASSNHTAKRKPVSPPCAIRPNRGVFLTRGVRFQGSALSRGVSSMETTLEIPTWLYNPALMRSSSRHRALICAAGQCRRGVEKHIASGSMSHFAAEYEPLIHGRWQRQRRQGNSPMMPGHSSP